MEGIRAFGQQPVVVDAGAVAHDDLGDGVGEIAAGGGPGVGLHQRQFRVASNHHQRAWMGDFGLIVAGGDVSQPYLRPLRVPIRDSDEGAVVEECGVEGGEAVIFDGDTTAQTVPDFLAGVAVVGPAGAGVQPRDSQPAAVNGHVRQFRGQQPVDEYQVRPAGCVLSRPDRTRKGNTGGAAVNRTGIQRIIEIGPGDGGDVGVLPAFVAATGGGETQGAEALPPGGAQFVEPRRTGRGLSAEGVEVRLVAFGG